MNTNSRPGVGIAVMVYNYDKLLLGLRKGAHDSDHFQFPGGHLEWNEGFVDCAFRETLEETGLAVVVNPIPVAVTNDFFAREDKHYVTIFMEAEYVSGEPRSLEPEKCDGWKWYSRDNMPDKSKLFLPIRNLIDQDYDLFKGRND